MNREREKIFYSLFRYYIKLNNLRVHVFECESERTCLNMPWVSVCVCVSNPDLAYNRNVIALAITTTTSVTMIIVIEPTSHAHYSSRVLKKVQLCIAGASNLSSRI